MAPPRRDFTLRFRDLGDEGEVLCRGIRAVVLAEAVEVVFLPDVEPSIWPPGDADHPNRHHAAARAVAARARYVVCVDEARPGGTETHGGTTALFVTRSRFRGFAMDLTAALAREGRAKGRTWIEWAGLSVVRFVRFELLAIREIAADRAAHVVAAYEGTLRADHHCPRCAGPYIHGGTAHGVEDRYCQSCGLLEDCRGDSPDYHRWYARWHGTPAAIPAPRDDIGDALWADVLASFDDDGPRLVFADHLIAQGDVAGELISIQCRLVETPDDVALAAREAELIATHHTSWLGPLAKLVNDWKFSRGLLHRLGFIERLSHTELRTALDARVIQTVRHLRVADTAIGDDGARMLADALGVAGVLARVDELICNRSRIGDAGAAAIAGAGHRLACLSLCGNHLTDAGARTLAAAAQPTLRELDLSHNRIGPHGAGAIAGSRGLAGLTWLDLTHNAIGPDGAAHLAEALDLPQLGELDLSWCHLGAGVAALRSARGLRTVQDLDLRGNEIETAAFCELVASSHLTSLRVLWLSNNPLGDRAIEALCDRAHALPKLAHVDIATCPISEAAVARIAASPLATRVRWDLPDHLRADRSARR